MSGSFHTIIDKIETLKAEFPERVRFNDPVKGSKVDAFEKKYDLQLPYYYKEFIKRYNGGYICDEGLTDTDNATAAWNSNHIFSLEELEEKYENLDSRRWKMSEFLGYYPFLPMCQTDMQEVLVFVCPIMPLVESPVFDAHHEEPAKCWGLLYEDFEDFMEAYLETMGHPNTIANSEYPSAFGWIEWNTLDKYWKSKK